MENVIFISRACDDVVEAVKQTSLKTAPASRQSFFVRGLWLSRLHFWHFSFKFSAVFRILHTIFTLSNHALPICASIAKFSSDEILRCMKYRGRRVLHEADDVHCPSRTLGGEVKLCQFCLGGSRAANGSGSGVAFLRQELTPLRASLPAGEECPAIELNDLSLFAA